MKGKAIYNPSGKAGEYSYWAVNFYNGCSANCDYCYCKKGVMSSLWSTKPTLKKTLINESEALNIFFKEMKNNLSSLREYGLFFNFTSDPFLKETIKLNHRAMEYCEDYEIPVKALTKQTWWIDEYRLPTNVAIGYTLTGQDDKEPGAASNYERIDSLKYFSENWYKTWASIEPVINIQDSFKMIVYSTDYVNHFKIGPLSGRKFDIELVKKFISSVDIYIKDSETSIYWKDGFIEKMGIDRNSLSNDCVSRDYKFWK